MTFTAGGRATKTTATTNNRCSVFDHSALFAEHLQNLPFPANPGFSGHFPATNQLFGIFLPHAAPTVMRAALCGKRPVGAATMIPISVPSPLALRPREAA